jgi:guanosine-3',5'-bis(diphosphate) 3'-pyrophosphohydrolase
MSTINDLLKLVKDENTRGISRIPGVTRLLRNQAYDPVAIQLAYDYAADAHKGQFRKSGEPYIIHPLETAMIVATMGLDQDCIIAALLHDVPEDTSVTLVDIEKNFGKDVARLVTGITKLGVIKYRGMERYAENLRKMFVSMAQDIRIILIKMADRVHNLRTLDALRPDKQLRIARESLEIYAPIANRLGMGYIKGMIEDLAFPYVLPEEYAWMQKEILPAIKIKAESVESASKILRKELEKEKVKIIELRAREKRSYSLYVKLIDKEYNRDLSKIYDLVALRVIVPTVADCYNTLGIAHKLWKPLLGRIKDYIAQPKPNGYQSLHTTVFGPEGMIMELQIRTPEMNQQAEYGIAAHWHYKELGNKQARLGVKGKKVPQKLKWVEDLVRWQQEVQNNEQYLQSLSIDVFRDRIFVFTPEGDVIDLPEDATPVDFAYHVHSWIGDHTTGAKVNAHMVSLDHKLKNGDVVEIITDKNRKTPGQDWAQFVKTAAARGKIRAARQRQREVGR